MESDEEFDSGLPKIRKGEVIKEVDLSEIASGRTNELSVSFDVPEVVETVGHRSHAPPVTVEKFLNKATLDQMQLKFLSDNNEEVLTTMFGDYSEIEPLMKNVTDDGGVKKLLIKPGTGKKVMPQNMVKVHYILGAEPMDDLIETTYSRQRPMSFRVGKGEVLPVMDIAVLTMRVGETSKFLATCNYGYGKLGVPLENDRTVPPDSRIMLQMEVVETYTTEKDESIFTMSSAERRELPFEKLFTFADEMKNDGNREFKDEEYSQAIKFYLETLEAVKDMEPNSANERTKYLNLRIKVCNNLAHAYYKMEKFNRALKWAEEASEVPVTGLMKAKSYYWRAKSLFELGRYEQCLTYVIKAQIVSPDEEITNLKQKVEDKIKAAKESEKELCCRMMASKICSSQK